MDYEELCELIGILKAAHDKVFAIAEMDDIHSELIDIQNRVNKMRLDYIGGHFDIDHLVAHSTKETTHDG